jgi:hypothetical protein
VDGTAPAGTAFVRIEFRLSGAGELWIDDVELAPTSVGNLAPSCADRDVAVGPGETVELAPACTDPDDDPLTYSIVTPASQGQASVVAGQLRYVSDQGATGTDSFTYRASDGSATSAPALVAVTITAGPDGGNLAPNPGFEEDPAGTWLRNGPCSFRWASDVAHTGGHSLFVHSTTTTLCRWYSDFRLVSAIAGRRYSVFAWYRPTGVKGGARLKLTFYSANGSLLPGGDPSPSVRGSGDWAPVEVEATAPAGTAFVRIEILLTGPGDLAADDVTLTEIG